jgi:DNA-binding MarR family transcriptional regulator
MPTVSPSSASARSTIADDPLELERQVCFALAVASRAVIGVYRPLLEPMRLTHPQYLVMLALWQHEPLTVTELASSLQLDPATLSPLLKRLETTGYISRRRDPSDERNLQLTLTPEGRELRTEALKIPGSIMQQLQLSLPEIEALHASLTDLIAKTKSAGAPAGNPTGVLSRS